ncbi:MAG: DUF6326 family protein [Candidatus Thorarchaeota archaeon]
MEEVKIKLSALWITLMFFYIYADILAYYTPGHIEAVISGEVVGLQINQVFLLTVAILMVIPSFMVFLSLVLEAKVNRWANKIIGILFIGILIITTLVPGEIWLFGIIYTIGEAVLLVLIVWYAWKWPTQVVVQEV